MKDELTIGEDSKEYYEYLNAQTDKRLNILVSRCKSRLFKQMVIAIQEKRLQLEDQDMFKNLI